MAKKKKKIEDLLEKFQGNAYPSMLDALGSQLGVTADSLARLGIGWAPIVPFKKGKNYQGWWVIPERDADAAPVGLSLRSMTDTKVMYPGSHHGLVYEVSPTHARGATAYLHGAHNWARTMDSAVLCPVCGKPDGCLVAADDLDEPKAAICIRTSEGSVRPMKFGYLHILTDAGKITKRAGSLPESDMPVIVVEGMTDAATAMDMGFVSVGRPSNLAGMTPLQNLLRGRDVIVVGENDDINPSTGRRPGHEGMLATLQVLRSVCHNVKRLLPPDNFKDLRQWVQRTGLSAEQFLEYTVDSATEAVDTTVIPDTRPLTAARVYLNDTHRMAERFTLRSFNQSWFKYTGSKYEFQPDEAVIGPLYAWAHDKFVQVQKENGEIIMKQVEARRNWVRDLVEAMAAEVMIDAPEAPCWINDTQGPEPRDLIAFANGIMHVPSYLQGLDFDKYMYDSTPDFFTFTALPFAFDPTALCPHWLKWTRSSLGDESAKIRLLQEWWGYCMTPDTRQQKMMFLRGQTAAGKSVAINVLNNLVGSEQFASANFDTLTSKHGMVGLMGKLVAALQDFRMPTKGDSMRALETILKIVGEDRVSIEKKFKDVQANQRLVSRFTMSSNEFPNFSDHSGALKRRLLYIEFNRSFRGREDKTLSAKFEQETPGIAVWALEGLRRLRETGFFTEPESMKEALSEWHRDASPISTFIEECVECREGCVVGKQDVFTAYRRWAEEHGHFAGAFHTFKQRLLDLVPTNVRSHTQMLDGRKQSVFLNVRLVGWASKQYLGHPRNS